KGLATSGVMVQVTVEVVLVQEVQPTPGVTELTVILWPGLSKSKTTVTGSTVVNDAGLLPPLVMLMSKVALPPSPSVLEVVLMSATRSTAATVTVDAAAWVIGSAGTCGAVVATVTELVRPRAVALGVARGADGTVAFTV